MILPLYRGLAVLAGPFALLHLRRRARSGKELPERLQERTGRATWTRPAGDLVWVHAASVGESASALPLIERLLREDRALHVLLTTQTATSARLLEGRMPPRCIHQFAPADRPAWVRRFLDHWRPRLALWVEFELWPTLILETRARAIPMALLNGRMSLPAFRRWGRFPRGIARLLGAFDLVLGLDPEHAARLQARGAPGARYLGNLKSAVPPLQVDATAVARLQAMTGSRPIWVAASTHAGEEEHVADADAVLRRRYPALLTILAPRHPERADAIAALLAARGLRVARRSTGAALEPAIQVYLIDTLGELGLFYRLAGLAFLGGSLVTWGGHNPLEPARLDCVVLSGPHTRNFAHVYARMIAGGAVVTVPDAAGLAAALDRLLGAAGERARLIAAGRAVAAEEAGVLDAVMAALRPLLPSSPAAQREPALARA